MSREYEGEAATSTCPLSFGLWLRHRCAAMTASEQDANPELMALSSRPSKKVCAFGSMTSYGCHYRVDMEEGTARHVTYDSGVAELQCLVPTQCSSDSGVLVELVRVGVLKNILVLNYGNLNIVLMVVSWVAKHTDSRPRLRRDGHGFWLANMSARPRDTTNPYLLPALASQVTPTSFILGACYGWGFSIFKVSLLSLSMHDLVPQVFFVEDKAMPGWFVVLKKEARGRRINSTELETGLGQELYRDDIQVLTNMHSPSGGRANEERGGQTDLRQNNRRRRRRDEDL